MKYKDFADQIIEMKMIFGIQGKLIKSGELSNGYNAKWRKFTMKTLKS
ncbi:MAG: hypothetical protein U5K79_08440 [Cyclobacteriaceae bacterium]|nr:hypothetical protein [Cyclobacteriaceae bacterium]